VGYHYKNISLENSRRITIKTANLLPNSVKLHFYIFTLCEYVLLRWLCGCGLHKLMVSFDVTVPKHRMKNTFAQCETWKRSVVSNLLNLIAMYL